MIKMRAKMRVSGIQPSSDGSVETLHLHAVCKSDGYPQDGSDEDNTYAKFTPYGRLELQIANPAMVGKFSVGETFYVDFIPVQ